MGVHTIISGKGCREYESREPLINLIERLNLYECNITRIDLAMDDRTGETIQLEKILEDVKVGNVVSKWKSSTEITRRNLENGEIIGQTINIGSRKSEVFLRAYDKSLEQKDKGNWNRLELEIKGDKAQKLQKMLTVDNVGILIKEIINNYFRIVEPSGDKNKSRWKTKEYWKNIIDTTEKTKLSSRKENKTLDELKEWVEKQIAPTLATIAIADGGSIDFLCDQIENGQKRLKPKHKKLIGGEHYDE